MSVSGKVTRKQESSGNLTLLAENKARRLSCQQMKRQALAEHYPALFSPESIGLAKTPPSIRSLVQEVVSETIALGELFDLYSPGIYRRSNTAVLQEEPSNISSKENMCHATNLYSAASEVPKTRHSSACGSNRQPAVASQPSEKTRQDGGKDKRSNGRRYTVASSSHTGMQNARGSGQGSASFSSKRKSVIPPAKSTTKQPQIQEKVRDVCVPNAAPAELSTPPSRRASTGDSADPPPPPTSTSKFTSRISMHTVSSASRSIRKNTKSPSATVSPPNQSMRSKNLRAYLSSPSQLQEDSSQPPLQNHHEDRSVPPEELPTAAPHTPSSVDVNRSRSIRLAAARTPVRTPMSISRFSVGPTSVKSAGKGGTGHAGIVERRNAVAASGGSERSTATISLEYTSELECGSGDEESIATVAIQDIDDCFSQYSPSNSDIDQSHESITSSISPMNIEQREYSSEVRGIPIVHVVPIELVSIAEPSVDKAQSLANQSRSINNHAMAHQPVHLINNSHPAIHPADKIAPSEPTLGSTKHLRGGIFDLVDRALRRGAISGKVISSRRDRDGLQYIIKLEVFLEVPKSTAAKSDIKMVLVKNENSFNGLESSQVGVEDKQHVNEWLQQAFTRPAVRDEDTIDLENHRISSLHEFILASHENQV